MADLLECLVQIRALGESPARLTRLLRNADRSLWIRRPAPETRSPLDVAVHLADTELLWGVRLRAMLTLERPDLNGFDPGAPARRDVSSPELAISRFLVRRTETVELLSACSATELARVGVHLRRGMLTVADLVALMLAHDTDHIGQIRFRLRAFGEARQEGIG